MNLIIDIGNTSAKLAIFEQNKLKILERSSASKLLFSAKKLLNNNSEISKILVASVTTIPDGLIANLSTQCEVMVLDRHFKMPFENLYKTPESLGIDRLALVAAAIDQYPKT
jgi:type III pantothenate kinase